MSAPRYSREDYARQVRRLVLFVDEADEEGSETVQVHKDVLRLSAAMLSEAANRAPTHAELVDRVDVLEVPAAIMSEISSHTSPRAPGAPQQDGQTQQPSAPVEGASEVRGDHG